jgi:hypothetical protein
MKLFVLFLSLLCGAAYAGDLSEIEKDMKEAEKSLAEGELEAGERSMQDVLRRLKFFIEKAEAQSGQGQSSSNSGQSRRNAGGEKRQSGRNNREDKPGTTGGSESKSSEVSTGVSKEKKGGEWGNLPPKEAREVKAAQNKSMPLRWREQLRRYYRALANNGE